MYKGDRPRIETHRKPKKYTTIFDWLNTALRRKKNSKDVEDMDIMKKIPRQYSKA